MLSRLTKWVVPTVFSAFALALVGSPAKATTYGIVDGGIYGLPTGIVAGDVYTTALTGAGVYAAGSGAFTDTYTFFYSPPPTLAALTTTVNNILSSTYGIPDLTFDWKFGGLSLISGPISVGAVLMNFPLPLFGAGFYSIVLAGTPLLDGGAYVTSLNVIRPPGGGGEVPLPPAVVLFGSALVGLALLKRRRSKRATEFTAA